MYFFNHEIEIVSRFSLLVCCYVKRTFLNFKSFSADQRTLTNKKTISLEICYSKGSNFNMKHFNKLLSTVFANKNYK